MSALVLALLALGALTPTLSGQVPRSSPAPLTRQAARPLAFTGVTVVDVVTGRLLPEQTVVVIGNRIRAVGPRRSTRVPKGAQVVAARGKYLIPGLWDMHAHVAPFGKKIDPGAAYRAFYPLFIAHGVTGIREMDQRFSRGADSFRLWRREILGGTRVGPRVLGPAFNVSHQSTDMWSHPQEARPHPEAVTLKTAADARRVVDSLKAAGMVFLKHHNSGGDRELYFALLREARRAGLPFVGHVPRSVSNVEAADSGQASIEHIIESHPCYQDDLVGADKTGDSTRLAERCAPVAEAYVRNGTWLTPTLTVAKFGSTMPYAQGLVRTLRRLGVTRFLAGSDFHFPPITYSQELGPTAPGRLLLEELGFLAGAGLTPLEVLQAATLHPAQFLDATDSLGTVAPGKLADLVLLDADPLADIGHVRQIRAVVANGRYFDRAALDRIAAEASQRAQALPWSGWAKRKEGWTW